MNEKAEIMNRNQSRNPKKKPRKNKKKDFIKNEDLIRHFPLVKKICVPE